MQILCLILMLLLVALPVSAQTELEQKWANFQQNRSLYLKDLSATVASCVTRKDTSHPVFHGCYDWHSAVHGHWALLRSHRLSANSEYLGIVNKAFTHEAMGQEFAFMRRNDAFEMPYGRAWFLLLISEFELVTGNVDFQLFGDFVAGTLQSFVGKQPFNAASDDYLNHAWVYTQLLNYYRHRNKHKEWKALANRINTESLENLSLKTDRQPVFFSRWSNLAHLLSHTMTRQEMLHWENQYQQNKELLRPVRKYRGAHHLAINYSRAWGFWSVYNKTNKTQYLEAYLSHTEKSLALHARYKDDYRRYGHWVSQFGIYALSVSDPRIYP